MALTIENPETEQLASEVAELTGESPAEVVRKALEERKQRLAPRHAPVDRVARLRRFLEQEVWAHLPPETRGKPLSKQEREAILGYGPVGVGSSTPLPTSPSSAPPPRSQVQDSPAETYGRIGSRRTR